MYTRLINLSNVFARFKMSDTGREGVSSFETEIGLFYCLNRTNGDGDSCIAEVGVVICP